MVLKVGAPDSDMYLGWFGSANKDKPPAEAGHFLGVHVGGPTRVGHYFRPAFATGEGTTGHTDKGPLALVLLDADFDHSARVIDRLVSRIENYEFPTALRIAVGAACYPTHAVDADSLKRQALSRPIVNWRGGLRSVDQN